MRIVDPLDPLINPSNECLIWLDSSDFTTLSSFSGINVRPSDNKHFLNIADGDQIGFWGNKARSSLSFHFTNNQGLTANRPFYNKALSAIDFRSLNQTYLSTSLESSLTNQSVIVFMMPRDGVQGYRIFTQNVIGAADSANVIPLIQSDFGGGFSTFRGGAYTTSLLFPRSKGKFYMAYYINSTSTSTRNGLNLNTPTTTAGGIGSLNIGRMRLGARLNANGTNDTGSDPESHYDGFIREVIVYNKSLTDLELRSIFYYLTGKWDFERHQDNAVYALSSGDWNSILWSTSALPNIMTDTVYSNGFNINIHSPISAHIITNRFGGGSFIMGDGVSLSAQVFIGGGRVPTAIGTASTLISYNRSRSCTLVGSLCNRTHVGGGIVNSGIGTLNMRGHVFKAERLLGSQGNNCNNTDYGTFNLSGSITGPGSTSGQLSHGANNNSAGIFNIIGPVRSGDGTNCYGANNASDGLMTIIGNISGGVIAGDIFGQHGATNSGRGTLIIRGDVYGGQVVEARGVYNSSTGILAITGNVVGGETASSHGAQNFSTGTIYIEGNAFGRTATGVINSGNGVVIVEGSCMGGGGSTGFGASNAGLGSVTVGLAVGNSFGSTVIPNITNACPGLNSGNIYGLCKAKSLQMGSQGMWPTTGNVLLEHVPESSLSARTFKYPPFAAITDPLSSMVFVTTLTGGTSFVPAVSNVRENIIFDLGSKRGTLIMPPAEVVLKTEPLDTGFGSASFDSDLIWTVPLTDIRALPVNTIGIRLLNVATLDRTGDARVQLR